jgi:hypothetical protein
VNDDLLNVALPNLENALHFGFVENVFYKNI